MNKLLDELRIQISIMGRASRALNDNLSQEAKKKHAVALNAKIAAYNDTVEEIKFLRREYKLNKKL